MSKWIKLTDQKPFDGEPVLVYTLSGAYDCPMKVAYRCSNSGTRCIALWNVARFWEADRTNLHDNDILYWRPFPKPPKIEQQLTGFSEHDKR